MTQLGLPSMRVIEPNEKLNMTNNDDQDDIQIKILSYFASRDKVYDTLA